jgi:hypothetical protein
MRVDALMPFTIKVETRASGIEAMQAYILVHWAPETRRRRRLDLQSELHAFRGRNRCP